MIILIAVPVLLSAFGIICARSDKKMLFCMAAAVCVFAVCGLTSLAGYVGADADRFSVVSTVAAVMPFDDLGMMSAPPAYLLIIRICSALGADDFAAPLILSCIQSLLAAAALYNCCSSPYPGAAILTFCFLPVFFAGSSVFTAALICLNASVYVRERRFFRYAAFILIAACFDISALLLLPLYFLTMIPNVGITAILSVLIAALAVLLPESADAVFGFLGRNLCTEADVPAACAVIAVIAAVLCALMYGMFRNRPGDHERLVPLIVCGAAFSAASVFDSRFFALSLMLLMQSAVVLAPEAIEIAEKFVGIMFPNYKMTSKMLLQLICALALVGTGIYLIYGNAFGSEYYEDALKVGLGI